MGLLFIESAIEHTPTLPDLYHVKARILKHLGNKTSAADTLEQGRALDTSDKWMNVKVAKYQLRCGRRQEAERVLSLFTRYDCHDSKQFVFSMQMMWFEIEAGHSYFCDGKIAMALKFFMKVISHFDDIEDDQLDFHTYCLRKFTIKSYVGMLRMINEFRSHPFFLAAMHGTVLCYIWMHDSRLFEDLSMEGKDPISDDSTISAESKRKKKLKARKMELKKQEEAKAALTEAGSNKDGKVKSLLEVKPDEDPDGEIMFTSHSSNPLMHAHNLLARLRRYNIGNLQTRIDMFDVQIRRGKYLQALHSLVEAIRIEENGEGIEHPDIFCRIAPL